MISREDKTRFLLGHRDELKPVVSNQEIFDLLEADHTSIAQQEIDKAIHESETRLYKFVNPAARPEAKSIIVGASEPLAYQVVLPILERLKKDTNCRSMYFLADNVAGKQFHDRADTQFEQVHAEGKTLFEEIPGSVDVGLFLPDSRNSPNTFLLHSSQSVLEAKKTYAIIGGWVGVGDHNLANPVFKKALLQIDGIFCNDELAKSIIHAQVPDYPLDKIEPNGTPVVDMLEREKGDEYRNLGRKKLGIESNRYAFLYLGDVSSSYRDAGFKTDAEINEKTFASVKNELIEAATKNPAQKFTLLVRPHPRDPRQNELFIEDKKIPSNLVIARAGREQVSIQEATYASDRIASIVSTENYLAPLRGRKSIFLGFSEPGMGREVLNTFYKPGTLKAIREAQGMTVADKPSDVEACIERDLLEQSGADVSKRIPAETAVDRIIRKILS